MVLGLLALGCVDREGPSDEAPASAPAVARLSVFAVNEPLRYLAARIGGDAVEVSLPVPPGLDPASWSPDADAVVDLQQADLVLLNGAGYEPWLARVSLPVRRLVDTSAGFADRLIARREGVVHQHGPDGEHSHRGTAFTTWLDPRLAREQARAVAAAFTAARPTAAAAFAERLDAVASDLEALDARLARAAARLEGEPLIFSHPVYAYLERRYGLDGRSLHWEPDEPPGAAGWAALDAILAEHPARLLIWEETPLADSVARLEARGLRSVVFSPGANRAASGESWLEVMQANAERLESVRSGSASSASLEPSR